MVACTKEGPTGPAGPSGLNGSDGSTPDVVFIPNPPSGQWTGSGSSSYTTTLSASTITADALSHGIVTVQWYDIDGSDTVFIDFPFVYDNILPAITFSSTWSTGSVTLTSNISQGFHQNPGTLLPGAAHGVKVAVIN